ncbi:hemolysin family protein [Catelliglobosispora koreensis]|uniref:hemolysin family protein n=1 Tax=Catelliglobosispora koreensis TaxID=129052 RepID=UPI00059108A7|nr:hemolysin family protein [Catelliglobosispora koreensis]
MALPRQRLARSIVRAADGLTRWTTRVLGAESTAGREQISDGELGKLIAANTTLDPDERQIIGKALARSRAALREVMVPRTEVWFLKREMCIEDAVQIAQEAGHTRFPVTDGSDDDVVGFVHLRDLIWETDRSKPVAQLVRVIKRLPDSKPVLAALSEMRRERHTVAVVIDEYGGTAGIVTLEDLIEELVGEIHDEYDETDHPAPVAGPSEVDGMLNLADFAERTGLALPEGPYETVGGFIMSAVGKIPVTGDVATIDGYTLTVVKTEGRRAARVRVAPVQEAE